MKLINLEEETPEIFYIFVDRADLSAQHNLTHTKQFTSGTVFHWNNENFIKIYLEGKIDYLPFIPNTNRSSPVVSAFANSITTEYKVEYKAELHRRYYFPLYPSRLSATYAFGSYEQCIIVNKKHGWNLNSVKRFKIIDHHLTRVAKVNMEIVSLDRLSQRISMVDIKTNIHIWNTYWSGQGNLTMELPTVQGRQVFHSGTIWEYLIEGIVEVIE